LALRVIAEAPSILDAIRLAPFAATAIGETARRASGSTAAIVDELVAATTDAGDVVTGIAAVHALAAVPGAHADRALAKILESGPGWITTHAAWATARRAPDKGLVEPLLSILGNGGLQGMHAQATLGRWARVAPGLVTTALRRSLRNEDSDARRHHLTETLGLIVTDAVVPDLVTIALDEGESDWTRVAAIAALGERYHLPRHRSIVGLALRTDRIGHAARLAARDGRAGREGVAGRMLQEASAPNGVDRGIRVMQVHLGAALDPDLLRSGMGDTGGIATLLVKLGDALGYEPGISEVVTVGRQAPEGAQSVDGAASTGHRYASVALAPEDGMTFSEPWPARVAAERGLRRVIRTIGRPDVIHLRMADPGTLAAANIAAAHGIQTVFSLAPDPHALIAARAAAGELDRRTFATEDAALGLWYRAHLVERLARDAGHVVLFPRERLTEQLRDLVGIDVAEQLGRFTVVPEGIDAAQVQRAVAARASEPRGRAAVRPAARAVADLVDRITALPVARHGLPIVLSVGRLSDLKGMARLADAFAGDAELRARATLVIVGGDLDDPSPAEAAELARIESARASEPGLETALVLLGHRPNGEVMDLLAAARFGVGTVIGPNGAYACASRKEEFGLAIVEALAAGLPVVAPLAGGPATYVEGGVTGCLVDTTVRTDLAAGVTTALDLAMVPGRAEHAARMIAERYDISAMAGALAGVYRRGDVRELAVQAS
jgi:glycosyltransferase involved in cell wall biosynthesis